MQIFFFFKFQLPEGYFNELFPVIYIFITIFHLTKNHPKFLQNEFQQVLQFGRNQ